MSSGPRSQQNLSMIAFCVRRFDPGYHNSDEVEFFIRRSSRLLITSNISTGTGPSWILCRLVWMWCDAALV